jgi:hypothetical protein
MFVEKKDGRTKYNKIYIILLIESKRKPPHPPVLTRTYECNNFVNPLNPSASIFTPDLISTSSAFCLRGKVEVKLCLIKHHAMKTHGEVEVLRHAFLTWALDGGEWSTSRPGRFTPTESASSTHWIGGWVGPRAGILPTKCTYMFANVLGVNND